LPDCDFTLYAFSLSFLIWSPLLAISLPRSSRRLVLAHVTNPSQIVRSVQLYRLLYIRYRTFVRYMTDERKLLGSTKVSTDNKVTIVKDAATILKITKGDVLAFYQENGRIYIEKG